VTLPGWRIEEAVDVNERGQIAITAMDDAGQWHSAILTPRERP